jgi:hypothetical protein
MVKTGNGVLLVYREAKLVAVIYSDCRVIVGDNVYTIPGIFQRLNMYLENPNRFTVT